MHVTKKVISNLNKCYAMSEVTVEGKRCFVVAAEKHDPCYLFSEEGELLEKVWDEPGDYRAETFDSNTGMANAMHFVRSDGKEIVVGTNREIDEVAYYEFEE